MQTHNNAMIDAFLLTRQWRDTPQGMTLELWFSTDNGPLAVEITEQQAVAFIREADTDRLLQIIEQTEHPASKHKDLKNLTLGMPKDGKTLRNVHGETVVPVYHTNYYTLRDLENTLSEYAIDLWEVDIRPPERFLMERFITAGSRLHGGVWQPSQNARTLINPEFTPTNYKPQLSVASVDIETTMNAKTLFSIGVVTHSEKRVFMVGGNSEFDDANQIYLESCATEKQCLMRFFSWVKRYDPDILIGWNVVQFDFYVLEALCKKNKLTLDIGRAGKTVRWREDAQTSRFYITVPGRLILDGIEVLKTAMYRFNSFSLNAVANILLDQRKLIVGEGRGHEIAELYRNNKLALARYNIQDCQLVWDIFHNQKLIDFAIARAQLTGMLMDRSGGSVASFEYAYLPRLHRKGYVAPNFGDVAATVESPGGYVLDSTPGIYQNVLVLDFKSLYPSIIRTFNIDPYAYWYSLHNKLDDTQSIEGFNGARFFRDAAILPGIAEDLWRARDLAKSQYNEPLSQAIKILMNSFYGVLGSPGCRFFDPKVSSSVTKRGHQILQQSKAWVEEQGHEVIYGDTDSIFVWVGNDKSHAASFKTGKELAQTLNDKWTAYLQEHFKISSMLEIEFETHYIQFLMPTIRNSLQGSKKRYAGIIEKDGQEELIFKGLENARTDWTDIAKEFQQILYRKIFAKQPVKVFIRDFVRDLQEGEFDKQLTYRKRLRRDLAAYQKNIPPHAQAARKLHAYLAGVLEQEGSNMPVMAKKGDWITYVLTTSGPEPCSEDGQPFNTQTKIDHSLYVERQIKPIADSILQFIDLQFDQIIDNQLTLF